MRSMLARFVPRLKAKRDILSYHVCDDYNGSLLLRGKDESPVKISFAEGRGR